MRSDDDISLIYYSSCLLIACRDLLGSFVNLREHSAKQPLRQHILSLHDGAKLSVRFLFVLLVHVFQIQFNVERLDLLFALGVRLAVVFLDNLALIVVAL